MSDQYIGEVRAVAFNFAPAGWALCNGQTLPIQQSTALFSLIGTYYGGDGRTTFALPNLQGATPIGTGQGPGLTERTVGEVGGAPIATLTLPELPQHTHAAMGTAALGTSASPNQAAWAEPRTGRSPIRNYAATATTTMNPLALSMAGGNQAHNNMPPFLAVNYIIALEGAWPNRP